MANVEKFNFCPVSWSVSRGRDTYGYNICRLDSRASGARYRCSGGGYDMVGTVLADMLCAEYQPLLRALADRNWSIGKDPGYSTPGYRVFPDLYGMTVKPDGTVHLDGACGKESVIRVAEAAGIEVRGDYNKRGHLDGFFVSLA